MSAFSALLATLAASRPIDQPSISPFCSPCLSWDTRVRTYLPGLPSRLSLCSTAFHFSVLLQATGIKKNPFSIRPLYPGSFVPVVVDSVMYYMVLLFLFASLALCCDPFLPALRLLTTSLPNLMHQCNEDSGKSVRYLDCKLVPIRVV